MGFNGKSLIFVGAILFIFQIANFISIETITPELERAQVLAAIASLIIILIGFLFKQFQPIAGEKAFLKGENKFLFDRNMPDEVIDELAWGSEAILTSTAAAAILYVLRTYWNLQWSHVFVLLCRGGRKPRQSAKRFVWSSVEVFTFICRQPGGGV